MNRANLWLRGLILITLLGISSNGVAQVDTWTKKADSPTPNRLHSASVVNGKIYVIGRDIFSADDTSTLEEYDPATDTWTKKADIPTPRFPTSSRPSDGL